MVFTTSALSSLFPLALSTLFPPELNAENEIRLKSIQLGMIIQMAAGFRTMKTKLWDSICSMEYIIAAWHRLQEDTNTRVPEWIKFHSKYWWCPCEDWKKKTNKSKCRTRPNCQSHVTSIVRTMTPADYSICYFEYEKSIFKLRCEWSHIQYTSNWHYRWVVDLDVVFESIVKLQLLSIFVF